jgi:hypothetical protein
MPAQTQTAAEGGNRQATTQVNGDNEKPPPNGMQHNAANGNVKVGNGKGRDQLFGADEDVAMQKAYEQHMAETTGPDFG